MKGLVLLNFKTYKEATVKKALGLAQKISKVKKNNYQVAIAPPLLALKEVREKCSIPVFAQHADPFIAGAHTGSITISDLKLLNVSGVILNHSERKLLFPVLKKTVEMCKKHKLKTVVCASSVSEVKKVAHLAPNYIAYEPKELIGGNISVTEAKPDVILKAVEAAKEINKRVKVLCGAGVQNKKDLGQALVLGTHGVLIGHAVPKAKNPKKFLEEMLL